MKSKFLFIAFLLIFSAANAQGTYVGFLIGYGAPGSETILGQNSESNNPGNTFSNENVKGSYGSGLNFGIHGGYMFDNTFGLELGAKYLFGNKYTFTDNSILSPNVTDNFEDKIYGRSLMLVPAILIEFGEARIRFFIKGGAPFGIMNKITDKSTETFSSPGTTDVRLRTFEYTKGLSIGFTSTLGMEIPLGTNSFFTIEATNDYINWAPKKGAYTEATLNGADELASMTTDEKQFEFVDKVDQTMNTSDSQPTQELRFYFPMNSFGIAVGMHFAFGSGE